MAAFTLARPSAFLRLSTRLMPWLYAATALLLLGGLAQALYFSPADYQQGETVRIMYVHVPAAWMALGGYAFLGLSSAAYLVWRHPLADVAARACVPVGAAFTAICLVTGSLWGKPMWGAWWVWDARLTSVLVLFFLYIGYMALESSLEGAERAPKACAVLALVGLANLPVIRYSVEWWNTLHQPASLIRGGGPAIHDARMLGALFTMGLAFACIFAVLTLLRMRLLLLQARIKRMAMET